MTEAIAVQPSVAEALEGYRTVLVVGNECHSEAHGLAVALSNLAQRVDTIAMELDAAN
jgi:hypothetical protein